MHHIIGTAREQLTLLPEAIEDYLTENNPVRFVDALVDSLELDTLGFQHAEVKETGRPPYHPKDLLKLYLYGYLNRIRTSRLLERETHRNLEVMWLLRQLTPDHWVINEFRKQNAKPLRDVFKQFVVLCKQVELFGAELVAVDSTKFKASNARDRVKDKEQLDRSVARILESINEYLEQLDANDATEQGAANTSSDGLTKEQLREKIAFLERRKDEFQQAQATLEASGEKYVSLTDADARLMKYDRHIEPAYALHTAVDDKHGLIVEYELTNDAADNNHLSSVATAAKETLGVETLTVPADMGYYDTVDLKTCEDNGIITYVPIPKPKISKATNVPTPEYCADKFVYDEASDSYRCVQGNTLSYYRTTHKEDGRRIRIYPTAGCESCPVRALCTTSPRGRHIHRWQYEAVLDRLKQRLAEHPHIIRRRKAIAEHPFGTIKKVWGYGSLLLRGLDKIASEAALMMTAYNIKRALTILGTTALIAQLQTG